MKHGPIALIDHNMPVVFIAPSDSVYHKIASNIEEVKARGGKVIAIVSEGNDHLAERVDHVVQVPATIEMLQPLLTVIPLQLARLSHRGPPGLRRRSAAQPGQERNGRVTHLRAAAFGAVLCARSFPGRPRPSTRSRRRTETPFSSNPRLFGPCSTRRGPSTPTWRKTLGSAYITPLGREKVSADDPEASYPWNVVTVVDDSTADLQRLPANLREADRAYYNYAVQRMRVVRGADPDVPCDSVLALEESVVGSFVDGWILSRTLFGGPPFAPLDELVFARHDGLLRPLLARHNDRQVGACGGQWADDNLGGWRPMTRGGWRTSRRRGDGGEEAVPEAASRSRIRRVQRPMRPEWPRPMTLRLHNTLTRTVEEFQPAEAGHVRMYTCGPTVYDRAHIGNFRAFTWEDLLRRYLKWRGYRVTQVMNLTDVDDRTIQAAIDRGVDLEQVTAPVTRAFFEDWETLGLEPVEQNPRATEHVAQMIELVRRLEAAATRTRRTVPSTSPSTGFPGTARWPTSIRPACGSGERVEGDENYSKENPRDFVLWKGGTRGHEGDVAVWDSPWGPGRPGWHLECSAMAMEYLGETLDIHTGGVDNIFPHHVNEIAQSEAATGKPFSRWWMHAEHLLSEGEKMSKSLGNFYTLESLLERGHRPSAIRHLLLSAHYRTQLNFTLEGLKDADRAVGRLYEFRRRLGETPTAADRRPDAADLQGLAERWRQSFTVALDEDLNVSEALGATFTMVREANLALDAARSFPATGIEALQGALTDFDSVFGVLGLREREETANSPELDEWIEERIAARAAARAVRDFARADAIRDELLERGVALEDDPSGTRWKLVSKAD